MYRDLQKGAHQGQPNRWRPMVASGKAGEHPVPLLSATSSISASVSRGLHHDDPVHSRCSVPTMEIRPEHAGRMTLSDGRLVDSQGLQSERFGQLQMFCH
jgi:hypothetical protein